MSEHVAKKYPRCPRCGSPLEGRNPYLPSYGRYECGSYDREDTATIECYRRQLAQAQEEIERLRRERASVLSILRDPTRRYSAKVIEAVDLFDSNEWECQAEGGSDD